MATAAQPVDGAEKNLLVNPGFEKGLSLTMGDAQVSWSLSRKEHHEGQSSLQIANQSPLAPQRLRHPQPIRGRPGPLIIPSQLIRTMWPRTSLGRVYTRYAHEATGVLMKRAFTLIELLVSIAIVAVLVSLMLPALTTIKDSANSAGCLSNLRQLGVAFQSYAQENFSRYPPINHDNNAGNSMWYTNLLDEGGYMAVSQNQWSSKEWGSVRSGIWRCRSVGEGDLYWGGGYGMLHHLPDASTHNHGPTITGIGLHTDQIARPSDCALLVDAESSELSPGRWGSKISLYCPFWSDWSLDGSSRAAARHRRRQFANVVFYDNHAKSVRYEDLKANANDIWRHDGP